MQHYTEKDQMLTIHPDRLISTWTVKKSITPADAASVFDFNLEKRPCYDVDGKTVPGLYHIARTDANGGNPSPLAIGGFGEQYEILQHREMLDMIAAQILPELPGTKIETVGTLEGGAVGMVQISAGRDFTLPGDTSRQESRLYFNNPTGGGSIVMGFCFTRCVCENTIAMARREVITNATSKDAEKRKRGFYIRHTSNVTVYARQALAEIAKQAKTAEAMKHRLEALAAKKVNAATIKKTLEAIYPATAGMADAAPLVYANALKAREEVIAQWESGETAETFKADNAWKLFNAYTFPIFNPAKLRAGVDESGVRYDGIFGGRAERVAKILETVERIAA